MSGGPPAPARCRRGAMGGPALALGWLGGGGGGGGPRERAGARGLAPGGWGIGGVLVGTGEGGRGGGFEALVLWGEGPPTDDFDAGGSPRTVGRESEADLIACLGWDGGSVRALGSEVRYRLGGQVGCSVLSERVVAVSCGEAHALACTAGGRVLAWGRAAEGQLGLGSGPEERGTVLSPEPVSGLGGGAVAVACGARHSAAVTSDGETFLWGWNLHGQAGGSDSSCVRSPRPLEGLPAGTLVAGVSGGIGHTMLWARDGGVWALGWDVDGQLGRGIAGGQAAGEPQRVGGGLDGLGVAKVSCGARHSVALTVDGRAFGWGWDGYGQVLGLSVVTGGGRLATGGGGPSVASPAELRPGSRFSDIACGWWHTLLLPQRGRAGSLAPPRC